MSQLNKKHAEMVKNHEAVAIGTSEKFCDFCRPAKQTVAKYDGKTSHGPWANMCDPHFRIHGLGLGLGLGQMLLYVDVDEPTKEQKRADIMAALEDGDFDAAEDIIGDGDITEYL